MRPHAQTIGSLRTELSLPIFPLEHRCLVCALYHKAPEVFDELSRRLIMAEPRLGIIRWLRTKRLRFTERHLSRHYQKHVRPYVAETLEIERRLRSEVMALEGAPEINIGSVLARKLASDGLAAARQIKLAALLAGATSPKEATDVLRELTRLCKALADIDRAAAEIRLKEIVVKLRGIELAQKSDLREQEITRWIELALRDHPNLAAELIAIVKPLPALPAPAPGVEDQPQPRKSSRRRPPQPAKRR